MGSPDFKSIYTWDNHGFPAMWRYILPEDAEWIRLPEERRATCQSCPKVADGSHHKDTQCCTYFPELVNYLLGFALQDEKSRPLIEAQIAKGHVLPTGQQIHPGQYQKAVQSYADNLFGELPSQACPFLNPETIQCGIYPYRNSVCSTFFCENDHGEAGNHLWEKTQDLVAYIEIALSQAAMQSLGIDVREYVLALDSWASSIDSSFAPDAGWSLSLRQKLWGKWFGREAEFLIACADWVLERKDKLYQIALDQTLYEARAFEAAINEWLPDDIRPETEPISLDSNLPVPSPIEGFWYTVQLAARQMWAIPFGEGEWKLSPLVELPEQVSETMVVHRNPVKEDGTRLSLPINSAQLTLLTKFKELQEFNEALMDSPEMEAVEDNRDFLAECLRQNIIVQDGKVPPPRRKTLPII